MIIQFCKLTYQEKVDSILNQDRKEWVVEKISEARLGEILRTNNKIRVINITREAQIEGDEKGTSEMEKRGLIEKD